MTVSVNAGEPLISYISLVTGAGAPVLGASFTTVLTRDPLGMGFPISVTEQGAGVYRMEGQTSTISPAGEWYALVEANDAFQSRFSEMWDVSSTSQAAGVQSAGGGLTRLELRFQIARDLGDFHDATATSAGTQSSMIDTVTFAREVNHFSGMQLHMVSGTAANIGQTRFIQSSSNDSQNVSFTPPLPANTAIGDVAHLYNLRNRGWLLDEYNAAINAAIDRVGELHGAVPYALDVTTPFVRTTPYIPIPEPFSEFSGIEYTDRQGYRHMIPPKYWDVDRAAMEVHIKDTFAHRLNGRTYRLKGRARPATLATDSQRTDVYSEWLVAEAKAILLEADVTPSMENSTRGRTFNMNRSAADGKRQIVINRREPNSIRLR
ncbi:MAG TPA: hypothetical protein VNJ04_19725 [Gemmatimonadaceae bacterium]|nr:hypothetical protein [Gemmatimonadaceae bacterium]